MSRRTYPGFNAGAPIAPEAVEAIPPRTVPITVMNADNEVGTVEPVPAAIAREAGVPFHAEAAVATNSPARGTRFTRRT